MVTLRTGGLCGYEASMCHFLCGYHGDAIFHREIISFLHWVVGFISTKKTILQAKAWLNVVVRYAFSFLWGWNIDKNNVIERCFGKTNSSRWFWLSRILQYGRNYCHLKDVLDWMCFIVDFSILPRKDQKLDTEIDRSKAGRQTQQIYRGQTKVDCSGLQCVNRFARPKVLNEITRILLSDFTFQSFSVRILLFGFYISISFNDFQCCFF